MKLKDKSPYFTVYNSFDFLNIWVQPVIIIYPYQQQKEDQKQTNFRDLVCFQTEGIPYYNPFLSYKQLNKLGQYTKHETYRPRTLQSSCKRNLCEISHLHLECAAHKSLSLSWTHVFICSTPQMRMRRVRWWCLPWRCTQLGLSSCRCLLFLWYSSRSWTLQPERCWKKLKKS